MADYDRLIDEVRLASGKHVSEWELGEALSIRAMYLEGRGRFKEALAGYLAVAELRRGNLVSNGHSLASALEAAVSVAVRAGQREKALSLAQEVIKLRGDYPYASNLLEEVARLLHEEQKRQSKRARQQQLRDRRRVGMARRRPTKS
jgi:tetratricopeptide (TPR) repeat protein